MRREGDHAVKNRPLSSILVASAVLAATPAAAADDIADFFAGKTIRISVAGGPGASLGLYARTLSEYLGRHIAGNPSVIVEFRAGAGGTIAASYLYNAAPKDGTAIAVLLPPSVTLPLLQPMKFDATRFYWLGSMTPRPAVVSVFSDAPATTLTKLRTTEVILGSSGKGSETYLVPQFMNVVLGTKFKIVTGYRAGDDINLAMERGEVHGRMQYWTGWTTIKQGWLSEGKLVHIAQYGPPIREIPNVPRLRDMVAGAEEKQMVEFLEVAQNVGMAFCLPPEVPPARAAALRAAFVATMADPALLADAKARNMEIEMIPGARLEEIVARAYATPKPVIEKLRGIVGFETQ
jgi:tripartite-type tricarboxylate transporter receptor subunit TctC